ncbi:MAG TPA: transporter [Pyrinomonadaceae bacterium]
MNNGSRLERLARRLLLLLASVLTVFVTNARAQQMIAPTMDTLPSQSAQSGSEEEEEFIKPSRPGVSDPAEIQKPGVLQLEYGYNADFRAEDFRTQQAASLTLRFAANSRLLLELDLDTVESETDEMGTRMTGLGDTELGFQVVALKDTEKHPAFALAYYVKLPTASEEKGLGTGRVDHKVIALLSKKLGQTDMDFTAAALVVGREDAPGWVVGGQFALSFEREFKSGFGLEGELSEQSKDDEQPPGVYALGALTYKVNRRLILDAGVRFGLNADAPRFGVFAGFTVGIADLYRKK